jgi:UDP-GlcNAc:undecaprenyl-phosphate GlcNAc-1-phosphate transferase
VGAIDDVVDLPPLVKLAGQVGAVLPPVLTGVRVQNFTLPFIHRVDLGGAGEILTIVGLVAIINVVNLSDGIDGLAAGVCAISAIALAIIAFDLGKNSAGVLAAITAGAAIGFLGHNFHPASVFMGDCGSNLLGYLLGVVSVQGSLKTNALVAVVIPLIVLAVPFLDTTFVVLKRMKYGRPVYLADDNHFHHRFSRIGFSQRRTVLYLYAWTACLAGLALAVRFVPYSDNHGHLHAGWTAVMVVLFLLVVLASVYLVYVLEILKFRRFVRTREPGRSEAEVDAEVRRSLETGEFEAVSRP